MSKMYGTDLTYVRAVIANDVSSDQATGALCAVERQWFRTIALAGCRSNQFHDDNGRRKVEPGTIKKKISPSASGQSDKNEGSEIEIWER